MTDKPGNKSDGWLEDESIVSRAYGKLGKPEPPVQLDEKILAEARRAAATRDATVIRVQRWRKWTLPAALAATVVFAVPLVVRVFESAPPDFAADRSSAVTLNGKTAMEIELAEPDTSLAELTSSQPPAPAVARMQAEPVVPAEMPGSAPVTAPVLAMERLDPEILAAQEQLRQAVETDAADISASMKSLDSAVPAEPTPMSPSGRAPLNSIAGFARATEPADNDFAAIPPGADPGERAASFRDDASEREQADALLASGAQRQAKSSEQRPTAAERRRANTESNATTDRRIAMDSAADPATAMMSAGDERSARIDESLDRSGSLRKPESWLDEIAAQYRDGHILEARRELGSFLSAYPGYDLPDGYPLRAEDALFDEITTDDAGEIVPEAAAWLRGIGLMAERGEIDQARTQLARFFRIYPDYPLPAGFPLSRDDALPIDQ